ncbi:MAG: hypothetical protein HC937_03380 [Aquincola sp.]|nr:hypothetical protein [Aquincola sp.]
MMTLTPFGLPDWLRQVVIPPRQVQELLAQANLANPQQQLARIYKLVAEGASAKPARRIDPYLLVLVVRWIAALRAALDAGGMVFVAKAREFRNVRVFLLVEFEARAVRSTPNGDALSALPRGKGEFVAGHLHGSVVGG